MKAPIVVLLLAAGSAAVSAAPLVPEYEITVRDAGTLKRVVSQNAWMKEFSGTNLYRGTMVRLGPLLFALGQKGKDSWDGRLVDFVVVKLLEGRPARLAYFDAPNLVSPFGVTLPALTPVQREAARLLLAGLRTGPDVQVSVALDEKRSETVAVTPVQVKLQKLAAVAKGACVVVSRDPTVAAALSLRCAGLPASEAPDAAFPAARLDVDVSQLLPSTSVVRGKVLGLEGRLSVGFDFDPREARFVPARAELPVAESHLVREAPLDEAVVRALPSGTVLFGSLAVPDPGALDLASLESYLRTARERPPAGTRTVTIASLGTRREGSDDVPLTALLVPRREESESGVGTLFAHKSRWSVQVSTACPGLLVLSPSTAAVAAIEAACTGKAPSLRQLPPPLLSRLTTGPASATVYLNLGRLLASALELGWARQDGRGAAPPEVASALELLDRLPAWALSGRVEGSSLRLRAAAHSPAAPSTKNGGRKP